MPGRSISGSRHRATQFCVLFALHQSVPFRVGSELDVFAAPKRGTPARRLHAELGCCPVCVRRYLISNSCLTASIEYPLFPFFFFRSPSSFINFLFCAVRPISSAKSSPLPTSNPCQPCRAANTNRSPSADSSIKLRRRACLSSAFKVLARGDTLMVFTGTRSEFYFEHRDLLSSGCGRSAKDD